MKIAAVCCTYLASQTAWRILYCFTQQDYRPGAYHTRRRRPVRKPRGRPLAVGVHRPALRHLGEKRNAAAALAGDDVTALAEWDDRRRVSPLGPLGMRDGAGKCSLVAPLTRTLAAKGRLSLAASNGRLVSRRLGLPGGNLPVGGGYPAINNGEGPGFRPKGCRPPTPRSPIPSPWDTAVLHLSVGTPQSLVDQS